MDAHSQNPKVQTQARAARRGGRGSRRHPRGQAMVEYSIINWILLAGLLLFATSPMVPTDGNVRMNVVDLFLRSLQTYQDSIYYLLNLPFP
jgi:hypothetical protein